MNGWLVGKSALVRLAHSGQAQEWATRIERGRVTTVTLLEVGYSARSGAQLRTRKRPAAAVGDIPDLLVTATAELAELTVLHLDKDFDLIAEVTGQRVERVQAHDEGLS